MSDTRQRITALSLIYRALYQSPDLRRVDVRQFLEELMAQLSSGDTVRPSRIQTRLQADDLEIDPDKLAPLALFAVEAISNARKHAFGDHGGMIDVRFQVGEEDIVLEIADDGQGEPEVLSSAGVGRTLMSAFARQLRGRAEIGPAPGRGVIARLVFPRPPPDPRVGPADPSVGAGPGVGRI
jgi:two-component sensor histidine kinase